ncbi:MAG: biosynthetic arginine decarboxylase [Phycisphaerae bacterium]|nr:biosynthetic arginine decarboxylase [Phycisphaerae bacterium]
MAKKSLERWTIDKSRELYGIRNWGSGFFGISDDGEVLVKSRPGKDSGSVSLMKIVSELKNRGLEVPVLLRFSNILRDQITRINNSFHKAIDDAGYKGDYRGVYPIKVNQQQQVLEDVIRFGEPFHYGLEAGSKPELMAAIAMLDDPEACLICNGYKDKEFIDLGLYAIKMGMNCFFVVEMAGELSMILERAEKLGIEPRLGVRLKLASQAGGRWSESGGDRSVFGLNSVQVLEMVDQLKAVDKLHCLKLLHYHLGSQIPNIRDIRDAVTEASRIYAGLVEEGAAMGYLDVGGGMAVDYDGSSTNFASSRNYSLDEYCADVIEILMNTLDEQSVAHPTLITECGRATVAYSSVLLFNILEVSQLDPAIKPAMQEDFHDYTKSMAEVANNLSQKKIQESYHDAMYYRDELRQLFKHGNISLRERAYAEAIFWGTMQQICDKLDSLKYVPDDFVDLKSAMASVYYGNFSLFQSLPDSWAIDQLFPIMPLHRLAEEPTENAIISDITCDCDGKIDKFIDLRDVKQSLLLHRLNNGDEYYLGVFLIGAYQETLGDLHNLFGDTNVVSVEICDDGEYTINQEIEGDAVEDVLQYVEYDTKALMARMKQKAETAIRNGNLTAGDRREVISAYQEGLRGYTYFEE